MTDIQAEPLPILYRPRTLDEMIGNEAAIKSIESLLKKPIEKIPHAWLFVGESGCVDKDTEYLSKTGWRKIDTYSGEEIMQWDLPTQKASFVSPLKYIKRPSLGLTKFKTKYGINQCLSNDHKVLTLRYGNWCTEPFTIVKDNHSRLVNGLKGAFLTSVDPILSSTLALTDAQIRVQVMFNADGTQDSNRKKGGVNIKKKRKIERARFLLTSAGIPFKEYHKSNGYIVFSFVSPLRTKTYEDFWKCDLEQLKVVASEVMFWDGDQKKVFSTMSKKCADFIQYVFSCTGKRATIVTHETGLHRVIVSSNLFVGLGPTTKMESFVPLDGYEYCFTVPSSYLVLRRKDRIFVTGNCGKTTLARIVKDELGCDVMDFKEYNSSNTRGIDTIRKLQEKASLYPRNGEIKVYLLDEIHMATKEAMNALLKLLEDPPAYVYFFLCTTNPEKLIRPIHSRCTTIKVTPVSSKKMIPFIKEILYEEIGETEALAFDKDVIKTIADNSNGACRDALKLLDMVIDMDDFDDMLDVIEQGVTQEGDLKTLCDLLKTPRSTWKDYSAFLKTFTGEPEGLRKGVLAWFSSMLLSDGNQGTAEIMEAFEGNYYDTGKAGLILSCFQVSLMK